MTDAATQSAALDVRLVVGLEIHVQLATATKMFCRCKLEFGAPPNTRVCPVCLGMPGSLPVMNRRAFELAVRTAMALDCTVARFTKWDRKSYYYPDLPKNYQISQYDLPLGSAGRLTIPSADGTKDIRVRRAHLEEDAGKLLHEGAGATSQVDLNRTGTPLLEIVTEPDLSSPQEVGDFGRELRRLVRHLGVSEANMQMGQMRLEPNINLVIRKDGAEYRTPIVECKNLNSFRHVEAAVEYEAKRQLAEWQKTGVTIETGSKSTRGWDPDRGVTFLQREKEEAHDYRYFPDPDLAPVVMDDAWLADIRATVCERPIARRARYVAELGLDAADADQIVEERANADLFEAAATALPGGKGARRLAKLLLSEGNKRANERGGLLADLPIAAGRWAEVVALLEGSKISATAAGTVIDELLTRDDAPEAIARAKGLIQTSDAADLAPLIEAVLADNPKAVADAAGPKGAKALGPLIGQVIKKSGGSANPKVVQELLKQKLGL
ncbi:MAG: Aspartyl/glutamyl-tRNA(Asn/Gln) amidotransferase subunit B [Phycisphaerae bacterium]|nr:Aspartyl/glutamyl-tRNA(Asn/Gln) amidotransferase subunit B [Phycisphaerae bacterium]